MGHTVILLACVQVMPGSDLNCNIDCQTKVLWFSLFHSGKIVSNCLHPKTLFTVVCTRVVRIKVVVVLPVSTTSCR
jgi:hypothetical protein